MVIKDAAIILCLNPTPPTRPLKYAEMSSVMLKTSQNSKAKVGASSPFGNAN